jgi:hypothetical protein
MQISVFVVRLKVTTHQLQKSHLSYECTIAHDRLAWTGIKAQDANFL